MLASVVKWMQNASIDSSLLLNCSSSSSKQYLIYNTNGSCRSNCSQMHCACHPVSYQSVRLIEERALHVQLFRICTADLFNNSLYFYNPSELLLMIISYRSWMFLLLSIELVPLLEADPWMAFLRCLLESISSVLTLWWKPRVKLPFDLSPNSWPTWLLLAIWWPSLRGDGLMWLKGSLNCWSLL